MISLTRCYTQVGSDFTRKCQAGLKKLIFDKGSNLFCGITRHCIGSGRLWLCTQIEDYLGENTLAYSAASSVTKIFFHTLANAKNNLRLYQNKLARKPAQCMLKVTALTYLVTTVKYRRKSVCNNGQSVRLGAQICLCNKRFEFNNLHVRVDPSWPNVISLFTFVTIKCLL